MFRNKAVEALEREISALRAQISDLLDQNLRIQSDFAKERGLLIDKIMALSAPTALLASKRDPNIPFRHPYEKPEAFRPNFPGFRPDLRPSVTPPELLGVLEEPASSKKDI